jgi:hypothetical protein
MAIIDAQAAAVELGGRLAVTAAFANMVTLGRCPGAEAALRAAGVGVVCVNATRYTVTLCLQ